MVEDAQVTLTPVDPAKMKVAEGGWLGNRTPTRHEDEQSLDGLLRSGYTPVNWDGV